MPKTDTLQANLYPSELEAGQWQEARYILRQVKMYLHHQSDLDARWLVGLAIGRDEPVFGHESLTLTSTQAAHLDALIDSRNRGCPVSRMRGRREFYSLPFYLNEHTFDPRSDSECLIDAAVDFAKSIDFVAQGLYCLDLGTGSGCLLLSLLNELPNASGLGVDLAPLAVAQARANAAQLCLARRAQFTCSNWLERVQAKFDLVLANPPYVSTKDKTLACDVADYDPSLALFAGTDGLAAFAVLLPQVPASLKDTGRLFLEIGAGQKDAVVMLAEQAGLQLLAVCPDLGGQDRCLVLGRK